MKEKIKEILQNDSRITVGAMLFIQKNNQTLDEQTINQTEEQNGIGFNKLDAEILGNFSDFFEKCGYLSDQQIKTIHKCMPKYWSQLQDQIIFPNGNMRRKAPITRFKIPYQIPKPEPDPEPIFEPIQEEQPKTEKKQEVFNPKNAKSAKNLIEIRFPYDPILIAQIKTLTGRRFNSDNYSDKHWTAPISIENIQKLVEFGFSPDENLSSWLKNEEKKYSAPKLNLEHIPGFKRTPYPFQKEGIEFIEARQGRALIADEMGLGKTIQALGWLQLHPEIRPVVIIAGASLKLNWEREIENSLSDNKTIFIANGKSPNGDIEKAKKADIIIINCDILHNSDPKKENWSDFIIEEIKPDAIIIDECQKIKNNKPQRTKEVKRIGKKCKYILALSGTPLENKTSEIYNIIQMIDPHLFPNFMAFALKYCDAKNNGYGWDFTGSSNSKELNEILRKTIMIRRKKDEVLKDLPPIIRSIIPIQITDRKFYDQAMREFEEWEKGSYKDKKGNIHPNTENPASTMVELEKVKQAAAKGKMKAAIEWIKDFLESGEKLVVFTVHREILDQLQNEFKSISVKVDGSVTGAKRQEAVDQFQTNDKIRLFLGNLKAAGEGLTLTAASSTATLEFYFNPSLHSQGESRVHRIGQEADSINAYYLVAKNTIEEKILAILDKKMKNASAVLDGRDLNEKDLFTELMGEIKK